MKTIVFRLTTQAGPAGTAQAHTCCEIEDEQAIQELQQGTVRLATPEEINAYLVSKRERPVIEQRVTY